MIVFSGYSEFLWEHVPKWQQGGVVSLVARSLSEPAFILSTVGLLKYIENCSASFAFWANT